MMNPLKLAVMGLVLLHAGAAWANPKGKAVAVGINRVDEMHYGSPLQLLGCQRDALDMASILQSVPGFDPPVVLNDGQATVSAVEQAITEAAAALATGDTFVFFIACHGSQLPDLNGDEKLLNSEDRLDETWLLYDRMWIDDERHALWSKFKEGVHILVIADTCHSGTSVRAFRAPADVPTTGSASIMINGVDMASIADRRPVEMEKSRLTKILSSVRQLSDDKAFAQEFELVKGWNKLGVAAAELRSARGSDSSGSVTRALGDLTRTVRSIGRRDALTIYEKNQEVYDVVLSQAERREASPVVACVILLAACQDFQTAEDGPNNGAFTATLKHVWNDGFVGTYEQFLERVKSRMYDQYYDQIPNYLQIGASNASFQTTARRPFHLP